MPPERGPGPRGPRGPRLRVNGRGHTHQKLHGLGHSSSALRVARALALGAC
ncbi:hypothetical protein AKJ09_07323 [Labilithrix luteola]|uniref:Uncharacterized protein n=1 Tax=Labilithrix luteola TaxID=1391654 RepID=A0A0K1Q5I3_9BACT|nr:hypothetical protein AKJ09_07323 [Labilithrix luteola]